MYWRNMTGFAVVKMKTLAATATGVFKTFSVRMLMKKWRSLKNRREV